MDFSDEEIRGTFLKQIENHNATFKPYKLGGKDSCSPKGEKLIFNVSR